MRKVRTIRTIRYGFALLLLLVVYLVAPASAKVPIITIDARSLLPLDQGLNIGQQAKALFPDIERRYDQFLATRLNQTHFDTLQQHSLPLLLQQISLADQQELDGLSAALDLTRTNMLGDGMLSQDEYYVVNLLADLGLAPYGSGLGAFGQAASDKGVMVGRNLDWQSTSELRHLQVITRYHYPQRTVVTIGFAGMLAVFNGFNDQGLFLAYFNAEPYSVYNKQFAVKKTMKISGFAIRNALVKYDTLQQAGKQLSKQHYSVSSSLLIADKKSSYVLEYQRGKTAKKRDWKSATQANKPWQRQGEIAVINCHVLAQLPNTCRGSSNTYHWQRLRQLARFDSIQPASITTFSTLLFDTANEGYELFNQHTLQSLLFLPTRNGLYLYTAPPSDKHPTTPRHEAYLDLIPHQQRTQATPFLTLLQAMWLLLLLLFITAFWFLLEPPRLISLQAKLRHCKVWQG